MRGVAVKMINKTNYKHFLGVCPFCNETNHFHITKEEINNNFTFSCSVCLQETDLKGFQLEEIKTAQEILNETPTEPNTTDEVLSLVTKGKYKRVKQ